MAERPTIVALGELLVEFVSHRKGCGLRSLAEYSGPYPSGAPAICLDQAARMGARTALYGSIGRDGFGQLLIERLQCSGVNTSAIVQHTDHTTGVAFVSYFEDGSRTFVFHLDGTAADAIDDMPLRLPDGPLLMHVSGASLGNARFRTAIDRMATQVLERGGRLCCDPNARAELLDDGDARKLLFDLMQRSHYLLPSTSDLGYLFPDDSEARALSRMQAFGAEVLVLKRGDRGAVIHHAQQEIVLPGLRVEEVDPTGAGDAFCGTFLARIAQGDTVDRAGRLANAAGAMAVTRRGPMEGNSEPRQLAQFMAEHS